MNTITLRYALKQLVDAGYNVTTGYSTVYVSSRVTAAMLATIDIHRGGIAAPVHGEPYVYRVHVDGLCQRQSRTDQAKLTPGSCARCGADVGTKCKPDCTRSRVRPTPR